MPTLKRSANLPPSRPLDKLERTIAARAANPLEKSYTSKLLAGGVPKIGAKVTEEAAETVAAAAEPDAAGRDHFIREVADLLYHLLVLMQFKNCTLADVETELARRFGVSGIEEKASRPATAESSNSKPRVKAPKKKPTAANAGRKKSTPRTRK